MIELLGKYSGPVDVNKEHFESVEEAAKYLGHYKGGVSITIPRKAVVKEVHSSPSSVPVFKSNADLRVVVKAYMTTYAKSFFLANMNERPMPLTEMVGRVIKETDKMYFMDCHGALVQESYDKCIVCGRTLLEAKSKSLGIGDECMQHMLSEVGAEGDLTRERLKGILPMVRWSGWILKSAILEMEAVGG